MPDEFASDDRGIRVLCAAGILAESQKEGRSKYEASISIIPALELYPRLANIESDDKVRMLRADTGERIYF